MGRFSLAWRILTNSAFARSISEAIDRPEPASKVVDQSPPTIAPTVEPPKPLRNDAILLLSVMQREGRLIDFLMEPISQYSDEQVGAAVRDIHRDCGAVLERQFAIRAAVDQNEGDKIEVGVNPDPGLFKLSGSSSGQSAGKGTLMHHGWKATRCELPQWNGSAESAMVLAPAEVQLD